MSGRRSPVVELEQLVRLAEPGNDSIARHLTEHGESIVPVLGLLPADISIASTMSDQILAARLAPSLRRWRERCIEVRQLLARDRSLKAAAEVARTSRWIDGSFAVDVQLVLGELVADRTRKFIEFILPDGSEIAVQRVTLVGIARLSATLPGLSSSVNTDVLRFRWRQGRGGICLLPQVVCHHLHDRVLHVVLPEPRVAVAHRLQPRLTGVERPSTGSGT